MNPENAQPDAVVASGGIADREEPLTPEAYRRRGPSDDHYRLLTAPINSPSEEGAAMVDCRKWEQALSILVTFALQKNERGERARRAIDAMSGQPFVSRPVWKAAQGVAWIFVAVVVSGDDRLKARANALINSVLVLASEGRASIGRAA